MSHFAIVVAVTAISPIELFRTRLQAARGVDGFACKHFILFPSNFTATSKAMY
jgi:hypothetical protein